MRARLRLLAKDAQGAVEDYRVLLTIRPQDPAVRLGLAGALIAAGDLDAAEQTLQASRNGSPDR